MLFVCTSTITGLLFGYENTTENSPSNLTETEVWSFLKHCGGFLPLVKNLVTVVTEFSTFDKIRCLTI